MATPRVTATGINQGDLVQLLYEIVYAMINNSGLSAVNASDFTVDVEDRTGANLTGASAT